MAEQFKVSGANPAPDSSGATQGSWKVASLYSLDQWEGALPLVYWALQEGTLPAETKEEATLAVSQWDDLCKEGDGWPAENGDSQSARYS